MVALGAMSYAGELVFNGRSHEDGRCWHDLDEMEAVAAICSGGLVHKRFNELAGKTGDV